MQTRIWIALATLLVASGIGRARAQAPVTIKEDEKGLLALAKVKPAEAQRIAQAKFPDAKVIEGEIEREKGVLIYSFIVKRKGVAGVEEVNVDALTGAIVSVEHESPAKAPPPSRGS